MVRRWRWAAMQTVWMALVVVPGCRSSQFECIQDSQCARDGAQGICQELGYCSFADDTCESGQRFSDLAADLAGACVAPVAPQTSSGGTATSGGTGVDSMTNSTMPPGSGPSTAASTEPPTDSSTTDDPVVDTTSSSDPTMDPTVDPTVDPTMDPTGEDATDTMSGGSTSMTETSGSGEMATTGEPPGCATPFLDEFDNASLGPGWQLFVEDLTVVEVMTELRFTMVEGDESYATLLRGPLDVGGGYIQARLRDLPEAPTSQLVFDVRTGTTPAHEHRLVLEGYGALRIIDGGELKGEVDLPALVNSLDIRLGFEVPGTVAFEYRVNDGSWGTVGMVPAAADLSDVDMRVIVGAWDPLTVPTEVVRLDTVSGCFADSSI